MDAQKILGADLLDILFEDRNKEYGAYDLRKTYPRRLIKALASTAAILVLLLIGYFLSNRDKGPQRQALVVNDMQLEQVEEKKNDPPPPPPPKPPPPRVEMVRFTPPRIVKEDVRPDEKPPDQDKVDDTKIGAVNQEGVKDEGLTGPPVTDAGRGVVEAPKKPDDDPDHIFRTVEIESQYPGGMPAWQRYLNKNLHYPEEAQNNEIQGAVMVQFIVDRDGNVSDVQAISGPEQGGLREEAVRVIRKSGKWTPAIQNGRQVKSYKKQPVTFRMND